MIFQNNHSPFIALALVVLGICVALGLLLGGTEWFNPAQGKVEAELTATAGAISSRATGIVVDATAAPIQQAATYEDAIAKSDLVRAAATQTVMAIQLAAEVQQAAATQNQLSQGQAAIRLQLQASATQFAIQAQTADDERINANRHSQLQDVAMVFATVVISLGVSSYFLMKVRDGRRHSYPTPSSQLPRRVRDSVQFVLPERAERHLHQTGVAKREVWSEKD